MEWKEVYIKDICTVLGDGLHGTPEYDEKGDFYFINGNNLQEGHITIKKDTKRVSQKEFLKYQKELNDRTILVSINGTIGNVAKYNNEPCILGKSACFFNVKEDIDRNFIYYVISSPHFKKSIIQQATGTTIKNVSLKQMRDYHFLIPVNLSDQRKIAGILSALDSKIENNNKINANLEAQAEALFKSWFVDFTPFKDQPFVDSELGPIPQGWKVGTLFDVANLHDRYRRPLSSNQRSLMAKKYPYYGATSLMDFVEDYIFDGEYVLMGEDGSVVTEKGYPFIQYVWGKIWVNNHAHVLSGKDGFPTELLIPFLKTYNIKGLVTGAVQAKLNQANMAKIQIPIPPKENINNISVIIKSIYKKYRLLTEENQRLAALRDTLLPKLMSGEIKL